jgi:hypothetical protein
MIQTSAPRAVRRTARLTGLRLLVFLIAGMLPFSHPAVLHAGAPTGLEEYLWLDVGGRPLPFQDHAAIQAALRSAVVISREAIGRGVAGTEKLVLEYDGARFHAAFRVVDVRVKGDPISGAKRPREYRDAAIFECAAYEFSELLGIGRVPPTVVRRLDGENGTLQIWMEATRPEVEFIEKDALQPPDAVRWRQQKQIMILFDSLIANSDRNQGNLLIDDLWNIWLIDHTRAFKQSSRPLYLDKLTTCERDVWQSLREIDDTMVRARLETCLESREISALLLRHGKLVRHIEGLIKKQGEVAVLFDLLPPDLAAGDRGD